MEPVCFLRSQAVDSEATELETELHILSWYEMKLAHSVRAFNARLPRPAGDEHQLISAAVWRFWEPASACGGASPSVTEDVQVQTGGFHGARR